MNKSTQFLSAHKQDVDNNQRIVLHTAIQVNIKMVLNIVLIHLSYQRQQQCRNMAEILKFITGMCIVVTVQWHISFGMLPPDCLHRTV